MLEVSSAEMAVRAGDRVSAYAGDSVSLSTQDVAVSAGGSVSALRRRECEPCEWSCVCECCGVTACVDGRDWFAWFPDRVCWCDC